MSQTGAIPQRPYLLRAMHAWITDNGQTPHVVVDASVAGVEVPVQYVRDGRIILNVSHSAVTDLDIGNDVLLCQARFSGVSYVIRIPVPAVLGIYARETGRGMIFTADAPGKEPESPPPPEGGSPPRARKGRLKVVK